MGRNNYCTRKPDFPVKAYLSALLFLDSSGQPVPYFHLPIFAGIDQILDKTDETGQQLKKQGIRLIEELIITPLVFESLYPLNKNYWNKPLIEYDELYRWKSMADAIKYFTLFKLIVTSSYYRNKKDTLTAAFAYKAGIENEIEIFMKVSDFPVSKSSKYAAIYSIEEPIRYNTSTHQIVRPASLKSQLSLD